MRGVLLGLACLLTLPSCQAVLGFEEFVPDDGTAGAQGDGGSSSTDGGSGGTPPSAPCSDLEEPEVTGTKMLPSQRFDGSCFWIDENEVTRAQYREFANSNPPARPRPCDWNENFTDPACEDASDRITDDDHHPQVCVDQCDAESYCLSVGKTLCRSSYAGAEDKDDWEAACTNAGETALPYPSESADNVCSILGAGTGNTTSDVRTNTACENDFGVRDLIGNVAEWTGGDDACKAGAGADDECVTRGGSFIHEHQTATCDNRPLFLRSETLDYVGFRCCSYVD